MSKKETGWCKGSIYVLVTVVITLLFGFSGLYVLGWGVIATAFPPGYNSVDLRGIGNGLSIYMNDNQGAVPDGEKWCDELIMKADMSLRSFMAHFYGHKWGETTIALNNAVINDSVTGDIVMLFEAEDPGDDDRRDYALEQREFMICDDKEYYGNMVDEKVCQERWNISGGPEILLILPGRDIYPVLFTDTHVSYLTRDELKSVRWDVDKTDYSDIIQAKIDKANLTLSEVNNRFLLIGIVLLAISLMTLLKYPIEKCNIGIAIKIISAISLTGLLLGSISHMVHTSFDDARIGSTLGLLSAIATSIFYIAVFLSLPADKDNRLPFFLKTVLLAAVCGGICSGLVHGSIVSITKESFKNGVFPGLLFGVSSGAMIGIVTFGAIIESKDDEGEEEVVNE